MKMNFSSEDIGNMSRLESLPSNRQGRFLGPLLGFFLASLFPNLAIARLQQGSIKFQYDPIPLIQPNQSPPIISIFQTPIPSWAPVTKPPEEFQLEPTGDMHHHLEEPIIHDSVPFPEIVSTNIESPSEYLTPPHTQIRKIQVKRAISPRYLTAYRRNRYSTRRRFPEYAEYDNYDYFTTPRLRNRKRNQGRRPVAFDYDYDYDYDYGKGQKRKQQRRKIKNKNRREPDYYSDDGEFDDDVESVTQVIRPRQKETTTQPTTTDTTTMPTTTAMNGSTSPTTTTTNTSITTGYGYGPYSGNENISITYGPPSAVKPVYGVPGAVYGTPLSEWTPSYVYESPSSYSSHHQTSYYRPSVSYQTSGTSYGAPSTSYGSPSSAYGAPAGSSSSSYTPISVSYGAPSASYGAPSSSHGAPSVSYSKPYATQSLSYGPPATSYGVPNRAYGVPSQSYGTPSHSLSATQSQPSQDARATSYHQSYQLPFSSWYGRSASHSDIVRRVQDIIRYD